MNVQDLTRCDVPKALVELGAESGHTRLLPVQELAARRYGLFRGESLIVCAPTSSGKTFVGEMAAGYHMMQGRQCLYLAPLKALAAEKFDAFRRRYAPLSARVVVSTRDDPQFDATNTHRAAPHLPCPHIDREMLARLSRKALEMRFRWNDADPKKTTKAETCV